MTTPPPDPPPSGAGVPGHDTSSPMPGDQSSPGHAPAPAGPSPWHVPPPPGASPPGYPPGAPPPPFGYRPLPPRPYDPLVAYDFSSWMDRVKGVVKRSWKRMLKLWLLGYLLPWLGFFVAVAAAGVISVLSLIGEVGDSEPSQASFVAGIGLAVLLYVVVVLAAGYLSSVVGLAAVKVAVNDAAEQPITLARAYQSSLRLAWPTFGWVALGGLVTMLGALACYLPGLYLTVGLSLVVPVMAIERRSGFVASFRWMHSNFWPAAGRVAATYAAAVVLSWIVSMLLYAIMLPLGAVVEQSESVVAVAVLVAVGVLLTLAVLVAALLGQVVMVSGAVVTYAELRGRQQPLTAAQLAAEVNA